MKNSNLFKSILYILGLGLICALFFIVFAKVLPIDVFWLDLIVSGCIYTLIMFNIGRLFTSSEDMDSRWGGLGIRWFFMWVYSILAVIAMVLMHINDIIFSVQILVQSGFLLILLFGLFFSKIVNDKVGSVQRQHQMESSGLNNIKEVISRFEIHISNKNPDNEILKELEAIKENIRYMSPSLDQMALDLENLFLVEMSDTILSISGSDKTLNNKEVFDRLNSCNTILKQRKNFRYN